MEKATENSVPQKGKLTNNKNSTGFLSPTNQKKKKSKSAKASSAIVANETDSLLHKAVSYDIDSDIGKKICSQLNCTISSSFLRENSIVGTVLRKVSSRIASGQVIYEVSWNNSAYGTRRCFHCLKIMDSKSTL